MSAGEAPQQHLPGRSMSVNPSSLPHGSDDGSIRSKTLHDASIMESEMEKKELHVPGVMLAALDGVTPIASVEQSVPAASTALSSLSEKRKHVLMLCFCLTVFIDAAGVSASFLLTAPISRDLKISDGDSVWVLGTYTMVFAATLLVAGRIADLYPPHLVYMVGFVGVAVFNLIISFMESRYPFFILRALSALVAVLTIPASINMIVQMYPDPAVQTKKLALIGLSGALANTLALILAGVLLLASWRWFFRATTVVIVPCAALAWYLTPKTSPVLENVASTGKWKQMDFGGVCIMVAALILFNLGFTQAPADGWNSAIFIAPFITSIVLLAVFVIWEKRMPEKHALLPHNIWSFPNIFPLMLQAASTFMWFSTAQLRLATYWQEASHESAIITAVKLLPMGVTAFVVGMSSQYVPVLLTRPRIVQPISSVLCGVASILFAFSKGGDGKDYWRYVFPGQIIGTAGGMLIFIGMNSGIIMSFPVAYAGVGGSFANIVFQLGTIVGVAIQAGLISTGDGTIHDWTGSRNSYFFVAGFVLITGLIFVIFYKAKKPRENGEGVV